MKKLFISIDISDDLASYLEGWIGELAHTGETRMVPEENYHITAYFIGYVSDEAVPVIERRLEEVVSRSQPFCLEFKGIVPAPPGRAATMLWAVFKNEEKFSKLATDLQEGLGQFGGGRREQIPHVTLLRSRQPIRDKVPRPAGTGAINQLFVDRITLMESVETQGGIYYKPLKILSLGK